jgi:hypothetical protein
MCRDPAYDVRMNFIFLDQHGIELTIKEIGKNARIRFNCSPSQREERKQSAQKRLDSSRVKEIVRFRE